MNLIDKYLGEISEKVKTLFKSVCGNCGKIKYANSITQLSTNRCDSCNSVKFGLNTITQVQKKD